MWNKHTKRMRSHGANTWDTAKTAIALVSLALNYTFASAWYGMTDAIRAMRHPIKNWRRVVRGVATAVLMFALYRLLTLSVRVAIEWVIEEFRPSLYDLLLDRGVAEARSEEVSDTVSILGFLAIITGFIALLEWGDKPVEAHLTESQQSELRDYQEGTPIRLDEEADD